MSVEKNTQEAAKTSGTKTTKKSTKAETVVDDVVVETPVEETARKAPAKEKFTARDIDLNMMVNVYNGYHGLLVYKSSRTGETFEWSGYGEDQPMELGELKRAKSGTTKKFFTENWFMFDEDWVVDFLGVGQYYKKAIPLDSFDEIFELSPDDLIERLEGLPNSQKRSVAYRAKQLIEDGTIDSNKTIATLEKCLGVELIER